MINEIIIKSLHIYLYRPGDITYTHRQGYLYHLKLRAPFDTYVNNFTCDCV